MPESGSEEAPSQPSLLPGTSEAVPTSQARKAPNRHLAPVRSCRPRPSGAASHGGGCDGLEYRSEPAHARRPWAAPMLVPEEMLPGGSSASRLRRSPEGTSRKHCPKPDDGRRTAGGHEWAGRRNRPCRRVQRAGAHGLGLQQLR